MDKGMDEWIKVWMNDDMLLGIQLFSVATVHYLKHLQFTIQVQLYLYNEIIQLNNVGVQCIIITYNYTILHVKLYIIHVQCIIIMYNFLTVL